MSSQRRVLAMVVAMVMATTAMLACSASGRSSTADSVSSTGAAPARVAATTSAVPDTAPSSALSSTPPTQQATPSRGRARASGGPMQTPIAPRSSGCGGVFVNVTVKESALAASTDRAAALRATASQLVAPLRGLVRGPQISPAIRAFRVSVTDTSATQRVISRLRAAPQVESVERDDCAVRIAPRAREARIHQE